MRDVMSLRKYNNSRVLCVRFDFRANRAVGCITFLLCHFCHSYINMWLTFTIHFMMALNEVRAPHERYHIGAHVILLRVEFLVCCASDTLPTTYLPTRSANVRDFKSV